MTQRILGPEGGKRRWRFRFLGAPVLLAIVLALFLAGGAQAVHDETFQLDGNTTAADVTHIGGNTQNADWNSLFNASGQPSPVLPDPSLPGFTASAFQRDFLTNPDGSFNTADASTFTTGSKDTLNITPGWQCSYSNNVNSKTDLSNVYAAFYTVPQNGTPQAGHQILYFGLERNDNSGDGNIAFWFLQDNTVGCTATTSGVNVPFTGNHRDGDLLIVSAFTNGGAVSNVTAYRWNGGAAGSLGTTPIANGGDCGASTLGTGDTTCAIVNKGDITVPWPTANKKDGTTHTLHVSEFFEGGLDLTQSNLAGKCFSSFLGDTRSSQSLTATIFDYATGTFEHCGANIQIAPNAVNEVGHTHTFTVTINSTNAGVPAPAPDGTKATVTLTAAGGAVISNLVDNCASTGTTNGTCTVSFTSNSAGTVSAHATADVTIQGTTFHVATDGQNGNSGDVTKRFVDANVSITPNGVNEVGHQHVFTITTNAFPAGTTPSLTSITPSATGIGSLTQSNTCASPVMSNNGTTATCTLTVNSTDAGTVTANATAIWHFADGDSGASPATADVTRSTDSTHGSSGPATKRFVDANVSIAPSGVNEVNNSHTFTVTSTASPAGTTATLTSLTPSVSGGLTISNSTCGSPALSNGGNTATCSFSINSSSAGTFTANATAVWHFAGTGTPSTADVTRSTSGNSGPGGSGPATKEFVDANVSIAPSGVNEVGNAHTFTVTSVASPAGTTPTITSITPSVSGGLSILNSTCGSPQQSGNTATCTFQINSNTAGTFTANATAVWHFAGSGTPSSADVTRSTSGNSGPGGSGPATKRFVDANITITPASAVNEVNHSHAYTITSTAFPSGTTATITSISASVSPQPTSFDTSDCAAPHQSGDTATCTVIINSSSAGLFTINATAVWHFVDPDANASPQSVDVTRSTSGNSGPGGSGAATKQFVDAYITIGPAEATNNVGQPHTFIVTVFQDDGLPANAPGGDGFTGFGTPPTNTPVTVTLVNSGGANWQYAEAGDLCASPNGTQQGTGMCTVTFSSPTAGTVTGTATVTFLVGGVPLTRTTDGNAPNSGPAIKHFVAGAISWLKVDNAGRDLAGATFTLCRTHDFDIAAGIMGPPLAQPVCITVVDNGTNDEDPTGGHFLVSGQPLGEYVITETAAPAGYVLDPNPQTVDLVPGSTSGSAANPFVNSRPVLKISGFGYTNAAIDPASQPDGIFVGTTTYTVNLHNYGTANADLSASSLVVSSNATCFAGNNMPIGGSIVSGGDMQVSLTCTYDHPNPAAITATLTVNTLTNGLLRAASGSPATITFTVNPN